MRKRGGEEGRGRGGELPRRHTQWHFPPTPLLFPSPLPSLISPPQAMAVEILGDIMSGDQDLRTSATLLFRLRNLRDQDAWNDFLARYTPRIYGWCRRYQLQETDAADITQEVLGKLVNAMRKFEYDPSQGSFRGWLKTVTQNAIRDLLQSWSKSARGSGDTRVHSHLGAIQAPDALAELSAEIEAEALQELLREAGQRIQLRVKPATWQAYFLTAVEMQPAADVAKTLEMPVAEVYVAKSRVLKMLRKEVEKLGTP